MDEISLILEYSFRYCVETPPLSMDLAVGIRRSVKYNSTYLCSRKGTLTFEVVRLGLLMQWIVLPCSEGDTYSHCW